MSKYVITLLLLFVAGTAICQKKSKVNLISSTRSEGVKIGGVDVIKVYNGVWVQDASRMKSDSAYFYQSQNAFDAFGHVNINQGDTLNIYSDKLNYSGNTKTAILTDNVKMIDKDATLTTNFFTYNTGTRIGTYTDGGKLVSKTNTLVSKNGYYFAGTHDAYFRYNVVGTTNDALIYTDTMRYNSQTKINYFYGPSRIYGTKDKDTLLTDYGTYDTKVEQALFTKNNLYKQGTKSLKGDTLFYDRLKGFGRAVKHVNFTDREQKITIKGGLGTYTKKGDLAIVTRDPYVILVTEEKDTTKTKVDTSKVTKEITPPPADKKKPSAATTKVNKPVKNTMPIKSGSIDQGKLINSAGKMLTMPVIDSFRKKIPKATQDQVRKMAQGQLKNIPKISADSAGKIVSAQTKKLSKANQNKIKAAIKGLPNAGLDSSDISTDKSTLKDTGNLKHDSVYMSADTIETRIITKKELDTIQYYERLAHVVDTSAVKKKPPLVYKTVPKFLSIDIPKFPKDTSFYHTQYFGAPKPIAVKPKPDKEIAVAKPKKPGKVDSTFLDRPIMMSDTARVRIVMAFHSAKIFKSDLQAVADSMFYSNSDSTIRCYTKPMAWTQGSQLSGDTINLIMKNKKLDKMDMFPNAFIVNLDKHDSTYFNQVGGKRMRGFFKDSKLSRVVFDGNVETNYWVRDSTTKEVTDLQHSFSSRMRLLMKNNEVTDLVFITKPDHKYTPAKIVKDEDKILKGFIWKPKDRPVSKESILPSHNIKPDTTQAHKPPAGPSGKKSAGGKSDGPTIKKGGDTKTASDSTLSKQPAVVAGKDTTNKIPAPLTPAAKQDTATVKKPAFKSRIMMKKDSTAVKPPILNVPVIKKDTTSGKPF